MARMLKPAIIKELKRLKVEFDPNATVPVLTGLIEEAQDANEDKIESEDEDKLEAPKQDLPEEEKEKDYLRKYQFRKNTVPGSKDSDPQPSSKAALMKKELLSQPRVNVMIPADGQEANTIKLSVTLNGYRLDFPKQIYLEVPKQIADVIMKSLSQTQIAIKKNRIDGNTKKEEALS